MMMMGQQEEEKKTGKENQARRQGLSSSSFHQDLISEVLVRLPAKSVAKSSCVSRLWSSITTHPCFIRSFEARSSKSPCLLISIEEGDELFVFSIPQHQNPNNNIVVVVDSYAIPSPKRCAFISAQSVNGLICVQDSGHPQIWNPTTRRFSTLPSPESCWSCSVSFLGYDPIDGTYKVLSLPSDTHHLDNHPRVLTLGGGESEWRVIQGLTDQTPFGSGQCINGVLYYIASLDFSHSNLFLVSFHVRSEKLTRIDVPWTRHCVLMACEGKLVSVSSKVDDITMWTLEEDAEKQPKWSCIRRSLPFPRKGPFPRSRLHLVGINDAGELIYVPSSVWNPFHILYFDPKGDSFRTVLVEGVTDGQFWLRNGFEEDDRIISTYPNHVESLMSL